MMIKNVNGYLYRIVHDYSRNAEVATCINCSTMPKVYGDSVNQVLRQAEKDSEQTILKPKPRAKNWK